MIANIVGNAVKFTHKGEVVVHVSQARKTAGDFLLVISVKDTGVSRSFSRPPMLCLGCLKVPA